MGVRLSASPNLFGPVINQDYYGDTSLGLLVTRPLWIPQVWRGDGPQVDSVSVFIIYYHSWILRLRSYLRDLALAAPRDALGGLALVGLPRAEPRRAIAAVGAWLCEGWCHLSAAVPGHRGGCVRHPGATLEGGGKELHARRRRF